MGKRPKKDMRKVEDEVFKENLKDAVKEAKLPEPTGKNAGIAGIIIGILGLFLPIYWGALAGFVAATCAVVANHRGDRAWGVAAGICAVADLAFFFIFMAGQSFI